MGRTDAGGSAVPGRSGRLGKPSKSSAAGKTASNGTGSTTKAMPFWVVVEAWDFGTLSKYFEIPKGSHQNRITVRLGITNAKVLKDWLQEINTLRNRSAHHTPIWNQVASNPLPVLPTEAYFQGLALDQNALSRFYGLICVIAFLLRQIGLSLQWLHQVADVIDTKPDLPGCLFASLGLPFGDGFPRQLFGI